jgi:hypothetical protein
MLHAGPLLEEPGHARNDEHEMPQAANHYHQRVRPTYATRMQKRPKLARSGLKEMRHEQIEAIPGYRDDNTDAKSPRAISTSE